MTSKISVKSDYTYVEKNIYKTNGKYRIRVGSESVYETNLKQARIWKKYLLKHYGKNAV
jgi:hypothetical protein